MAKELLKPATLSNAKPEAKEKRLNDGGGLYLLIKPTAAKWWRFDYSINGKRKTLSLDTFPEIGLADARHKAEDARKEAKAAIKLKSENQKRLDAGLPILNRGGPKRLNSNHRI